MSLILTTRWGGQLWVYYSTCRYSVIVKKGIWQIKVDSKGKISCILLKFTFQLLQVEIHLLSSHSHTHCGHLHPYRVFLGGWNNIINIKATFPWSLPWFLRIGQIVAWPFVRFHHFLINAHANYIITHTTHAHDTTRHSVQWRRHETFVVCAKCLQLISA